MVAGEVVHLIECLKIKVEQRVTQECYNELHITWRKQDYFLLTKTKIIVRSESSIHCDPRLPSMLRGQPRLWFKMLPNMAVKVNEPKILEPAITPTWTYNSLTLLGNKRMMDELSVDKGDWRQLGHRGKDGVLFFHGIRIS